MAPNLNLISAIDSASKLTYKKLITCPKGDLVKELCFQVTVGHLRSFRGQLVAPKLNPISAIHSISQKKKTLKRLTTCPKVDLVNLNTPNSNLIDSAFRGGVAFCL